MSGMVTMGMGMQHTEVEGTEKIGEVHRASVHLWGLLYIQFTHTDNSEVHRQEAFLAQTVLEQ